MRPKIRDPTTKDHIGRFLDKINKWLGLAQIWRLASVF